LEFAFKQSEGEEITPVPVGWEVPPLALALAAIGLGFVAVPVLELLGVGLPPRAGVAP
jgi:hypothetical protein